MFFKKIIFLVLFSVAPAWAMPARVILIRHGEKPKTGTELNERGWQRARALPGFFKNNPGVNTLGTPVSIYAMAAKGEDGSVRAIQTVTPLAEILNQKIHASFKKMEIKALVEEIKNAREYEGKMVLICWEHKVIPLIAEALGLKNAPEKWGNVYDRAWVLSFEGDQVVDFKDLPQMLLPGDSKN